MRIVCISDTHGQHAQIELPEGDLLLHAGDISSSGEPWQVESFLSWFSAQPHPHKVFIAGNHDFLAERNVDLFQEMIPPNVHYLKNEGIEIAGIKIWGSPITPWFFDWAFNRHRGEDIRRYWQQIPTDTDILLTHGPVYGIRDLTFDGKIVGCEELNAKIWEVKPLLHVFGHIHEGYGISEVNGITFVNASILDLQYRVANLPVVMDWELLLKASISEVLTE
ncbi:MAG: metallophosphatase domain-containing protein [Bacteroidia bacterium]|nr:metallophosphatase domain-containing protein [Bacteroidia bacterium]